MIDPAFKKKLIKLPDSIREHIAGYMTHPRMLTKVRFNAFNVQSAHCLSVLRDVVQREFEVIWAHGRLCKPLSECVLFEWCLIWDTVITVGNQADLESLDKMTIDQLVFPDLEDTMLFELNQRDIKLVIHYVDEAGNLFHPGGFDHLRRRRSEECEAIVRHERPVPKCPWIVGWKLPPTEEEEENDSDEDESLEKKPAAKRTRLQKEGED